MSSDRLRLRVGDLTNGAEIPWHASRVAVAVFTFSIVPRCATGDHFHPTAIYRSSSANTEFMRRKPMACARS